MHALQTTDALGAAAVHLGPRAVAFVALLNKHLGLSHRKIARLLRSHFALTVTPSAVTRALHRAARQAQPTYAALCATIRGSPIMAPNETSWKVNGHAHWLWAFATPTATVYAIRRGRGFREAASMLGAEFGGTLVRDGWCAYKEFTPPLINRVWPICCGIPTRCAPIIRARLGPPWSTRLCAESSPCGDVRTSGASRCTAPACGVIHEYAVAA